jgi:OOP family OmpA-OmpF porin
MPRAFAVCALLVATSVSAQQVVGADVEQQWMDPAGRGSLLVGNGLTLESLDFRLGAAGFYTHGNLGPGDQHVLRHRLGLQVFGALGVTDWLEVGAVMPVFVYQEGSAPPQVASAGLGNPWLYGKVNLLDGTRAVQAAAGLGLALPVGTSAALGNGGFAVAPRLQLGKVYEAWQWGAELGFLYRPVSDYTPLSGVGSDKVGSQVWLAGTASSVNSSGPRGEVSVRVHAPLTGGLVGVEGQLGVRWPVGGVELFASAGPGFFGNPSTPDVRVYVGAAFANTGLTQPACVEGRAYELSRCPELDRDGDGIKNALDRAPRDPEDHDDFEDEDGVPDPDNDGDGLPDGEDQCPSASGPSANRGCPDADADRDGVVDRLDKCPAAAEDLDGVEDDDGCPDPDPDGGGSTGLAPTP